MDSTDGAPVEDPAADAIPVEALPDDDVEFAYPPPPVPEPAGEPA